jgi:5-methylcytosine-specific restriction endonuclease McrA
MIKRVREKAVHPSKKGPRGGKQYICSKCKKTFGAKDISVDHRIPVVRLSSSLQEMSYDQMVEQIFCNEVNLEVLCIECHKTKTARERKERKAFKDAKKFKDGKKSNNKK